MRDRTPSLEKRFDVKTSRSTEQLSKIYSTTYCCDDRLNPPNMSAQPDVPTELWNQEPQHFIMLSIEETPGSLYLNF